MSKKESNPAPVFPKPPEPNGPSKKVVARDYHVYLEVDSEIVNLNRKFNLADSLAGTLLEGIVDKHGVPLIIHCRSVCNRCKDLTEEQRLSALLHECLEDGSLPYADNRYRTSHPISIPSLLVSLFGEVVSDIVISISRNMHTADYTNDKLLPYFDYIEQISDLAIPVKLADLEDNLDESRGEIEQSLRDRYIKAREILLSKV